MSGVSVRVCVSTQKSLQDLRALGTVEGKGKVKAKNGGLLESLDKEP